MEKRIDRPDAAAVAKGKDRFDWRRSIDTKDSLSIGGDTGVVAREIEPVFAASDTAGESKMLLDQLRSDRDRIAALEQEVADLRDLIGATVGETGEQPRKVRLDRAKREIKKYFEDHHGRVLYPTDIAIALRLELAIVERAITMLEKEAKIARA